MKLKKVFSSVKYPVLIALSSDQSIGREGVQIAKFEDKSRNTFIVNACETPFSPLTGGETTKTSRTTVMSKEDIDSLVTVASCSCCHATFKTTEEVATLLDGEGKCLVCSSDIHFGKILSEEDKDSDGEWDNEDEDEFPDEDGEEDWDGEQEEVADDESDKSSDMEDSDFDADEDDADFPDDDFDSDAEDWRDDDDLDDEDEGDDDAGVHDTSDTEEAEDEDEDEDSDSDMEDEEDNDDGSDGDDHSSDEDDHEGDDDDTDEDKDTEKDEETASVSYKTFADEEVDPSSLTLARANEDTYYVFCNDVPAFVLKANEADENVQGIWNNRKSMTAAFIVATEEGISPEVLNSFGAKPVVVNFEISKLKAQEIEMNVEAATKDFEDKKTNLVEDFQQSVAIAAVGIDKGAFGDDITNPLFDSIVAKLAAIGVKTPQKLVQAAFVEASSEYQQTIVAKALELMNEPIDTRNAIAKMVENAKYQLIKNDGLEFQQRLSAGYQLVDDDEDDSEPSNVVASVSNNSDFKTRLRNLRSQRVI